ncbi:MAG: LytR C-terminal domain-containing protein [Actinomycetaceae bacterium]|nr:LytR C-terminal domain-containing protein [Actinomycetaceae bacterium]MDU0970493.1 LytR C-terminal domain-containing protein [Actinomycetaceae bacterium]
MSTETPMSPRDAYLKRRRQRETLIFTWTGAILVVLLIAGTLIGFGIVPFPFFSDFARGEKIAQAGDVPCPTGEAEAIPPTKIEVSVLNGTSRAGLASEVGSALEKDGFKVMSKNNAPDGDTNGTVQITAGPAGVNSAYTVALAFPDSRITLDSRLDSSVTVTIGGDYDQMVKPDEFRKALDLPLEPRPSCLTVSLV